MEKVWDMLAGAAGNIVTAILVAVIGFFVIKLIMNLLRKFKGFEKLDQTTTRFILNGIKWLLYVILIMLIFGSNMFSVLLAICISSWVGLARQVRAQVMSQKEQEYALAAKVLGASDMRILFRHLVKNSIGPIIVNTTLMVPSAIFTEAFLSFVGIGISIPMASWGTMANEAKNMLFSAPLQMVWPVSAICLTMLALNFIGDGLNQALDPKKRSR